MSTLFRCFVTFMKLLPIALFFTFCAFGQQTPPSFADQKRDSVAYYLKHAQDTLRVPFLLRAMKLSEEIQNDTLLRESTIEYGLNSYRRRDTLGMRKAAIKLNTLYTKNKDSISLAKAHHLTALFFRVQYKLDSSYYYYHQSKSISSAINDSLEVAKRLLSMAYMQNDEKDYIGAQASAIEGLRYIEPLKEIKHTTDFYNILGNILVNTFSFTEARRYFNKAKTHSDKSDSDEFRKSWKLHLLNNIGNAYLQENKPIKALPFLEKGLEQDKIRENYPIQYQGLLGNYSECLYMKGEKEKAWKYLKQLLEYRENYHYYYGQSLSHNGLAYYYLLEEKNQQALSHAKKGYDLAKQVNNNATRLSALLKLGELTSGEESKRYYREYAQLNDSLTNRERYLKNQFAKVRYETEKKDQLNADLQFKNKEQEQEVARQKQQKIIGWLFSLAAILMLVLVYTSYRNKQKRILYEAQLQKASAREEERQQIAKSLHDEVAGDLRMLHQKMANSKLSEEAESIEKIKNNVRNLSHQLSSVSFDQVSFKDQLINLISDAFSSDFKIAVEGMDRIPWKEMNNTIKRIFYLCIRESLQNTLKYAEATEFQISFSMDKKQVFLTLKDNGKGIDQSKSNKGIGLKNLKERVEEIRGSFTIASNKEGTLTNISIPVNG